MRTVSAHQPLFTFRQLSTVRALLGGTDAALAEVLRSAGLDVALTNEVTAPIAKIQQMLKLAAERTASAAFGIDLAERIPEGSFGVTEFVVRSAPTIRQALSALCELAPVVNPAIQLRYIADLRGCEIRFVYADKRDVLGEILNEYTVAYIARQMAVVLGRPLPLVRAWFAHARTAHLDTIAQRLGCSVDFRAADCGFAIDASVIDARIPHGNEALHDFLLAQGRAKLVDLGNHDIISQVARAIEARLSAPDLGPGSIARALAMSDRTMQRQLADAGTSYRNVVAAVRRRRRDELARAGLDDAAIASRLGFSSAKTLRRSLADDGPDDE